MPDRRQSLGANPVSIARLLRKSYEIDLGEVRAFLPGRVPLDDLPSLFQRYSTACAELPSRYSADRGGVRSWLAREFRRDEPKIRQALPRLSSAERDRLMTILSVLGHTYRWDCVPPSCDRFMERRISLPPGIAEPWSDLARISGQPRVGTMWSLHLCNWSMKDRLGGAAYGALDVTSDNTQVAHNWLAPPADKDLDRFSISFVLLEARGAAVLKHLVDTVDAIAGSNMEDPFLSLGQLHTAVKAVTTAFSLYVRKGTVDPAAWLHLVQPTFPWSAEADEPGRVEGGPSGIQMGTIQALDAALGVEGNSELAKMARTGRRYMPRPHRRFLELLDRAGPVISSYVRWCGCEELTAQFNKCLGGLSSFRATHKARGAQYLRNQPDGDAVRASTGLTIGIDDNPIETFERTMAERAAETEAAKLT